MQHFKIPYYVSYCPFKRFHKCKDTIRKIMTSMVRFSFTDTIGLNARSSKVSLGQQNLKKKLFCFN